MTITFWKLLSCQESQHQEILMWQSHYIISYLEKKNYSSFKFWLQKSGILLPTVLFFCLPFWCCFHLCLTRKLFLISWFSLWFKSEFCCRMLFVRGSKVASKKLVFLILNFQNLNVAPTHIFVHYMLYRPDKVSQTSKKNRAWLHTEPNMIKFNMTPDVKKGL